MFKHLIKLQIKAQSAVSGPPLGPALGQFGIPTMDFCKKFNELSNVYKKGVLIITHVYVNVDRTYRIELKGPSNTALMKGMLGVETAFRSPGHLEDKPVCLTSQMLFEHMTLLPNASAGFYKSLKGTAQSSGFLVLGL